MKQQLRLFADREEIELLVVDADGSTATTIERRLRRTNPRGYHIRRVRTIEAALMATSGDRDSDRPVVVALRVEWVEGETPAGLGQLRRIEPSVPVIVLYDSPQTGTLDVLSEPFHTVITEAADVLPMSDATGERIDRVVRAAVARKRAEMDAIASAFVDPVTGLHTRSWALSRLERAIAHRSISGPGWELVVLFVDLDRFKAVNDTLGHGRGDGLLRLVGQRLHQAVRPDDLVARFGGDEFVVTIEGHRVASLGPRLADRILSALAQPFDVDGHVCTVSASVGLAIHRRGDDLDDLLEHADLALYEAKRAGRNRVVAFDADMRRQRDALDTSADALAAAIAHDGLALDWRAVVDLYDDSMVGCAGSVCWAPGWPEVMVVSAGDALHEVDEGDRIAEIARRTGQLAELSEWSIGAMLGVEPAGAMGRPSGERWLRLPRGSVLDVPRATCLIDHLKQSPVDPHSVVLLVAESDLDDRELVEPACELLSALGVAIGVDWFGLDAGSMHVFTAEYVDYVRLPRSLTAGCGTDPTRRSIIEGLIRIADAVGQSVACPVGDLAELTTVRRCGAARAEVAPGLVVQQRPAIDRLLDVHPSGIAERRPAALPR